MIEYIGLAGTVTVLIAFTRKGELQIRLVSLIGAILFLIYGILLSATSVILLNWILIGVHVQRIIKLRKEKAQ
ncbi:MAG: hypothetical protein CVU94_00690 [Firmicutes bacterium HGW-Firmicutes-19]|nr:MAG: hypothetical protein CVU94_00690 [Firmicutes bacterium HGW-Firmicutes-19]